MPQQQYDYDLFTIGGGSGGVRAARFAAQYGARVALAEKRDLGGTCVNVGCIPKKLMSYAAHYHDDLQEAAPYGWSIDNPRFDWATLIANKDREIARLNGVYRKLLDDTGVTLFQGHATIVDAHTVAVGEQRITARHILIATGGRPMRPDVPGGELGIVSDDFFHLPALPKNAIVVGGGYIAVELASILNGLGSKVTLVHRSAQLLRGMDADLGVFLAKEIEKKGITVRLDTQIASIAAEGEVKHVALKNGETIAADCILFATGRQPNVEGMGLDQIGVQRDERGAVVVDADFRTSVPSIYAVGDVIDRVALTPVALAEGMVVASALFGDGKRAVSYDNIPTAVFSHPNVGTVGLSEDEARRRHGTLRIYKSEFRALKSTISGSSERVLMKLVVDEASDCVLGVHLVGPDAGEIVQGFAVALNSGATKAQFDATIGVHPTLAEEFVTMRTPV
ncbi:glutathione-disulfide reductase [Oxalicibacterium solurbis]|uniref:Glutathione-disulfide reductase n=1 Tax=Oxalicibacterium solurbis TaxID=69280 RepID=A0A8J3F4V7_9BURK|nr:glutathione-disulfide reductase [Oxalicibacterium solurbis]GGI54887.1 glutathione-disulfide reductase [Oxalicibacterium solurbis]